MSRPNIYDRISERRLATEALARAAEVKAEEQRVPLIERAPACELKNVPSRFSFGGFDLQLTMGAVINDASLTLDHDGEAVTLRLRRYDVPQGQTLDAAFTNAAQALHKQYPGLTKIRTRNCRLAGHPAKQLDYYITHDAEESHGRLTGALMPLAGTQDWQWLGIFCAIDPTKPALSRWLIDFDSMLEELSPT